MHPSAPQLLRLAIPAALMLIASACAGRSRPIATPGGTPFDVAGMRLRVQSERAPVDPEMLLRADEIARELCESVIGRPLPPIGAAVPIIIRDDDDHQRRSAERGAPATFGFYAPGDAPEISISAACWRVNRNRHRVTRDLPLDALPFVPYGIIGHELTHAYLDAAGYRAANAEIYPWAAFQLIVERIRAERTGLGLALSMQKSGNEKVSTALR